MSRGKSSPHRARNCSAIDSGSVMAISINPLTNQCHFSLYHSRKTPARQRRGISRRTPEGEWGVVFQMNGFKKFSLPSHQTLDSIAAWRHSRAEGTTMAHIDHNVRIYHATNPTGEQLLGLQAPRWPDA